jgi:hypothetical protein
MKKIVLTIVYGLLCFIPLTLLKNYFGITSSWWVETILTAFSLFVGSFAYTQIHGTQVMELRHLGSVSGTNRFQVTLKVSGYGILNIVGEYTRVDPYSDSKLQANLFKALNSFPGSKWIMEFVADKNEKILMVTIDDPETPHPFNFTQVYLEKFESQKRG